MAKATKGLAWKVATNVAAPEEVALVIDGEAGWLEDAAAEVMVL